MVDNNYTVGTCQEMCPSAEIKLRSDKKLIHFYERKNGIFIKEFTRSAADRKMERAENLRTLDALRKTLEYLFDV